MNNYIDQFSELLSNPLGDLIASIGKGVGEAQAALDSGSLAQTLEIYREDSNRSEDENKSINLMREIGYQPTFYVIPETKVEALVSISLTVDSNQPRNSLQPGYQNRLKMMATPLNAGNMNRYNLNANAAAKLKFKIVPVPPPTVVPELRIVPNLIDRIWSTNIEDLLKTLNVNFKLSDGSPGTGKIIGLTPASGEFLQKSEVLVITLASADS